MSKTTLPPPKVSKHKALSLAIVSVLTSSSLLVFSPLAMAQGNSPVINDSDNPPSISIEGNENTTLLYNKYGNWTNVTATSDKKVASITGISLTTPNVDSFEFKVLEETKIHLVGIAEPNNDSAGNVEGIIIESSPNAAENGKVVNAHLHNVTIFAESTDPQFSRAKGIWIHGAHSFVGGDDGETKASSLTIDGDLDITAISKGAAIGINVGDELGDANGHGTGNLTLKGDHNRIEVKQTQYAAASLNPTLAIASTGILGSNRANITINSQNTEIYTETHHAGLAANQGGIVIEHASSLNVAHNLLIQSTATNAASSNSLHGISVDRNADVVYPDADGSTVTLGDSTSITLKANTKTNAYGLASYGKGTLTANGSVQVTLDVSQDNIGGFSKFAAVYADTAYAKGYANNGGQIKLNGALEVLLPETVKPGQTNVYALLASGEPNETLIRNPSIEINGTSDDIYYHLNGNINAVYGGEIRLSMDNSNSYLTGWADNHAKDDSSKDGFIDLSLTNGAVWNVISKLTSSGNVSSEQSVIDNLDLSGGTLNMSYATQNQLSDWEDEGHRQLLVISGEGLTGTGGTIYMDINLADEGSKEDLHLDQIIVDGTTAGTHSLNVNFTNGLASISGDKYHSENWLIEQNSGSMTLTGPNGTNSFTGQGMVSMWSVKFVPEGQEDKLDTDRESLDNTSSGKPDNGKGHWYLVRNDQSVDNPDLPPEIDQNITIGTSTGPALAYMADLEDLRKRIGEVRYGAQDGLWAKAFTKQDSVNGHHSRGFEQEAYGINIGFDKLVSTDETSSWLIGAAFRYGTADQEGSGVAGSATGELDEYSVKAYATWMHDSGSYADFVLQAGRYDQELKGLDNTGTSSTHADYDTWGYGASIEVGHMFTIANAEDDRPWFNHWFIEPQFELSYFRAQGADYHTSTGMKVEQDDSDFLTGRAGLVIGKKFNYGTADDLDKRYFQAALIGGVKHEFLGGDQTIHYTGVDNVKLSAKADDIAGTRIYYGVNMDWQLAQDLRLFGEVSREEGDGYTKDYDVSIGLKYSF